MVQLVLQVVADVFREWASWGKHDVRHGQHTSKGLNSIMRILAKGLQGYMLGVLTTAPMGLGLAFYKLLRLVRFTAEGGREWADFRVWGLQA